MRYIYAVIWWFLREHLLVCDSRKGRQQAPMPCSLEEPGAALDMSPTGYPSGFL